MNRSTEYLSAEIKINGIKYKTVVSEEEALCNKCAFGSWLSCVADQGEFKCNPFIVFEEV